MGEHAKRYRERHRVAPPRFCEKCGSFLRSKSIRCDRCGNVVLCLDSIEELLSKEKAEERKRAFRDRVRGRVEDVSGGVITIKCETPRFEEGDVVGYVEQDSVKPLGVVLIGGETIAVEPYRMPKLREGQSIELCEGEVLVGYDLQLELIRKMKEEELDEFERNAVNHVFGKHGSQSLCRVKPTDIFDVRDRFPLDDSQLEAVEYALGLRDGESLLIIGPPGTGKTRVIAKIAYELSRRGEKVLIASHTNRAVDNALEILPVEITLRVGRPEKVLPNIRPYLLSWKAKTALGARLENLQREIASTDAGIRHLTQVKEEWCKLGYWEKCGEVKNKLQNAKSKLRKLYEERNLMLRKESERLVKEAKIIGSTLIKSQLPPLVNERFDTVLIDECSQASLTLALLGMVKARKWVLVGDHKQLLPIFQTLDIADKEVREKLSAFCYMLEKYSERSVWLRWHYRSNTEIIGFSSRYIYDGKIAPVESCKKIKLNIEYYPKGMEFLKPELPVVFLHVKSAESVSDGSRFNEAEAKTVKSIVDALRGSGIGSSEIGVITPYRAQREYIQALLNDDKIEVNTVDSFQGREKDVIIFSVTSTKDLSFVEDENRLNVAFTRARKKLIVVGNAESIRGKSGLLSKFLSYVEERGGYFIL